MLPEPAPDFSQPLDLLHACHGRIEKQCATMLKLADHLARHGCDVQARQAAQAVLKYFASAAVHHHEDEEYGLFPMLREKGGKLCALADNLTRQHRDLEAAWRAVAPWLEVVARGEDAPCDPAELDRLVVLYRRHIELEETELLPRCREILDTAQLESLGRSMAARRGVV